MTLAGHLDSIQAGERKHAVATRKLKSHPADCTLGIASSLAIKYQEKSECKQGKRDKEKRVRNKGTRKADIGGKRRVPIGRQSGGLSHLPLILRPLCLARESFPKRKSVSINNCCSSTLSSKMALFECHRQVVGGWTRACYTTINTCVPRDQAFGNNTSYECLSDLPLSLHSPRGVSLAHAESMNCGETRPTLQ